VKTGERNLALFLQTAMKLNLILWRKTERSFEGKERLGKSVL